MHNMHSCLKDPFFTTSSRAAKTKVIMPSSIIEWNTTRALAGTSSFGFSGTNSHGTLAAPNDGEGRAVPLERALEGRSGRWFGRIGEIHCQRFCKCFLDFQNNACSKTHMSCKILSPKACKIQNILTKKVFQFHPMPQPRMFLTCFFHFGKVNCGNIYKNRERSGQLLIARFDFYTKPRR